LIIRQAKSGTNGSSQALDSIGLNVKLVLRRLDNKKGTTV
jgi:hypothetical protein